MTSLLDEQYHRASEEKHNPRLRDERWERSHPSQPTTPAEVEISRVKVDELREDSEEKAAS